MNRLLRCFALLLLALGSLSCGDSAPPAPHVLLLTVDTLRSDHLGINGHPLPTTPFLDHLLGQGVLFPNTLAPTPRTTPSLASLLTGAYPHTTGVRTLVDPLGADAVSLAQTFAAHGYATRAVVSNHVLTPERELGRGFEVYDMDGDWRDAAATTDVALRHAAELAVPEASRPVFLWVHYIDPHVPYMPPQELAEAFDPGYAGPYKHSFGSVKGGLGDNAYPEELGKANAVFRNPLPDSVNAHVRTLYAADVRATDDQMARLVAGLQEALGENWLVVFTADHGESLGEHDFFYDHGDYVYQPELRVPLGFVLPPGDPRRRSAVVEDWASLVDVVPTLTDLLGFARPEGLPSQVEGRSLLPSLRGEHQSTVAVFAECGRSFYPELVRRRVIFDVQGRFRTVIHDNWKLIWTPGQTPELMFELYDLTRDPGETRDLYAASHPQAQRLAPMLRRWVDLGMAGGAKDPTPLSAEDEEKLRSLGYID